MPNIVGNGASSNTFNSAPRQLPRLKFLMANSRAINKLADARMRATKRQRVSVGGSYHERVLEETDFEVVHAREAHMGTRHRHVETPRSPQKGRTEWAMGETWMPEDDPEIGLDPAGDWYEEELEKEVMSLPRSVKKPSEPKKRSVASVGHALYCSASLRI